MATPEDLAKRDAVRAALAQTPVQRPPAPEGTDVFQTPVQPGQAVGIELRPTPGGGTMPVPAENSLLDLDFLNEYKAKVGEFKALGRDLTEEEKFELRMMRDRADSMKRRAQDENFVQSILPEGTTVDDFVEGFAKTKHTSLANLYEAIGTEEAKKAAETHRTLAQSSEYDAEGGAAFAGETLGSVIPTIGALLTGPVGTAAMTAHFAIQGVGQGRKMYGDIVKDTDVKYNPVHEIAMAVGMAVAEVGSEYLGLKVLKNAAADEALKLGKETLKAALKNPNKKPLLDLLKSGGKLTAITTAEEGGEEAVTAITQDVIEAVFDPRRGVVDEGLADYMKRTAVNTAKAAAAGAAGAGYVAPAVFRRARRQSQQFREAVDQTPTQNLEQALKGEEAPQGEARKYIEETVAERKAGTKAEPTPLPTSQLTEETKKTLQRAASELSTNELRAVIAAPEMQTAENREQREIARAELERRLSGGLYGQDRGIEQRKTTGIYEEAKTKYQSEEEARKRGFAPAAPRVGIKDARGIRSVALADDATLSAIADPRGAQGAVEFIATEEDARRQDDLLNQYNQWVDNSNLPEPAKAALKQRIQAIDVVGREASAEEKTAQGIDVAAEGVQVRAATIPTQDGTSSRIVLTAKANPFDLQNEIFHTVLDTAPEGVKSEAVAMYNEQFGTNFQTYEEAKEQMANYYAEKASGLRPDGSARGLLDRVRSRQKGPFDFGVVEVLQQGDQIAEINPNLAALQPEVIAEEEVAQPAVTGASEETPVQESPLVQAVPEVKQGAARYAQNKGIEYSPDEVTPANIKPETRQAIADAFAQAQHSPEDPAVKTSYDAFKAETKEQFDYIVNEMGIQIVPWTGDPGTIPYSKASDMVRDLRENKRLYVFLTETGFGSDQEFDSSGHPMLEDSDVVIDGKTLKYNDLFRIVHDVFGHLANGNEFNAVGEDNAWREHQRLYSDAARPAMFTETLAQSSTVFVNPENAGPLAKMEQAFDAFQNGNVEEGQRLLDEANSEFTFADQKATILPEEVRNLALQDSAPQVEAAPRVDENRRMAETVARAAVANPNALSEEDTNDLIDSMDRAGYTDLANQIREARGLESQPEPGQESEQEQPESQATPEQRRLSEQVVASIVANPESVSEEDRTAVAQSLRTLGFEDLAAQVESVQSTEVDEGAQAVIDTIDQYTDAQVAEIANLFRHVGREDLATRVEQARAQQAEPVAEETAETGPTQLDRDADQIVQNIGQFSDSHVREIAEIYRSVEREDLAERVQEARLTYLKEQNDAEQLQKSAEAAVRAVSADPQLFDSQEISGLVDMLREIGRTDLAERVESAAANASEAAVGTGTPASAIQKYVEEHTPAEVAISGVNDLVIPDELADRQVSSVLGYGNEFVVFELTDGNVLKIAKPNRGGLDPEAGTRPFDAPILERGEGWYVQPKAKIGGNKAQRKALSDQIKALGYEIVDGSQQQIGEIRREDAGRLENQLVVIDYGAVRKVEQAMTPQQEEAAPIQQVGTVVAPGQSYTIEIGEQGVRFNPKAILEAAGVEEINWTHSGKNQTSTFTLPENARPVRVIKDGNRLSFAPAGEVQQEAAGEQQSTSGQQAEEPQVETTEEVVEETAEEVETEVVSQPTTQTQRKKIKSTIARVLREGNLGRGYKYTVLGKGGVPHDFNSGEEWTGDMMDWSEFDGQIEDGQRVDIYVNQARGDMELQGVVTVTRDDNELHIEGLLDLLPDIDVVTDFQKTSTRTTAVVQEETEQPTEVGQETTEETPDYSKPGGRKTKGGHPVVYGWNKTMDPNEDYERIKQAETPFDVTHDLTQRYTKEVDGNEWAVEKIEVGIGDSANTFWRVTKNGEVVEHLGDIRQFDTRTEAIDWISDEVAFLREEASEPTSPEIPFFRDADGSPAWEHVLGNETGTNWTGTDSRIGYIEDENGNVLYFAVDGTDTNPEEITREEYVEALNKRNAEIEKALEMGHVLDVHGVPITARADRRGTPAAQVAAIQALDEAGQSRKFIADRIVRAVGRYTGTSKAVAKTVKDLNEGFVPDAMPAGQGNKQYQEIVKLVNEYRDAVESYLAAEEAYLKVADLSEADIDDIGRGFKSLRRDGSKYLAQKGSATLEGKKDVTDKEIREARKKIEKEAKAQRTINKAKKKSEKETEDALNGKKEGFEVLSERDVEELGDAASLLKDDFDLNFDDPFADDLDGISWSLSHPAPKVQNRRFKALSTWLRDKMFSRGGQTNYYRRVVQTSTFRQLMQLGERYPEIMNDIALRLYPTPGQVAGEYKNQERTLVEAQMLELHNYLAPVSELLDEANRIYDKKFGTKEDYRDRLGMLIRDLTAAEKGNAMDDALRPIARKLRDQLDRFGGYLTETGILDEAGLILQGDGGAEGKHYFPRVWDIQEMLENEQKWKDLVLKQFERRKRDAAKSQLASLQHRLDNAKKKYDAKKKKMDAAAEAQKLERKLARLKTEEKKQETKDEIKKILTSVGIKTKRGAGYWIGKNEAHFKQLKENMEAREKAVKNFTPDLDPQVVKDYIDALYKKLTTGDREQYDFFIFSERAKKIRNMLNHIPNAPKSGHARRRSLWWVDENLSAEDGGFKDFIVHDPMLVLPKYYSDLVRQGEYARRFGADNTVVRQVMESMKLAYPGNSRVVARDVKQFDMLMKGIQGTLHIDHKWPGINTAVRWAQELGGASAMTLTGMFTSVPEYGMIPVRLGMLNAVGSLVQSIPHYAGLKFGNTVRFLGDKIGVNIRRDFGMTDLMKFASDVSVIDDAVMQAIIDERVYGFNMMQGPGYGSKSDIALRWFSKNFYKLNMLHYVTEHQRTVAMIAGMRHIDSNVKRKPEKLRKRDIRALQKLGLYDNYEEFRGWYLANKGDRAAMAASNPELFEQYKTAVHRVVNQSITHPNTATRPGWGNSHNPVLKLAYQLKSFSNGVREGVGEHLIDTVRNGDWDEKILILLRLFPLFFLTYFWNGIVRDAFQSIGDSEAYDEAREQHDLQKLWDKTQDDNISDRERRVAYVNFMTEAYDKLDATGLTFQGSWITRTFMSAKYGRSQLEAAFGPVIGKTTDVGEGLFQTVASGGDLAYTANALNRAVNPVSGYKPFRKLFETEKDKEEGSGGGRGSRRSSNRSSNR